MMQSITLIEANGEKLTTNSIVIAELFGRPHHNVLKKLDRLADKVKFNFIDYIDNSGRSQRMCVLDERAFLTVMPFIGGKKSFEGQMRLVDEFLRLRKILNDPGRKEAIQHKRNAHRPMLDMLKFLREEDGKELNKFHCMSQNLFINRALTGKWAGINEAELDTYDARLLEAIRNRDTILMAKYPLQADRRHMLDKFVSEYRAKHPRFQLIGGAQ
ncbi:MAG: Rha family transcriptional regulator [Methylobacter sp.]